MWKNAMIGLGLLAASGAPALAATANFEDLTLPGTGYYNGSDLGGGFSSGGIHFANEYSTEYFSWRGFAGSSKVDTTTPGFMNQYSVYTGAAASGTQFGVAYGSGRITLPAGQRADSVKLTNTTYTALDLNTGSEYSKKFGGVTGNDPDYFKITFTGYLTDEVGATAVGAVDFYLADFRFEDNAQDYVVDEWTSVNLSGLGESRYIQVSFETTDVSSGWPNTPTYAAIDDLVTVPEPASLGLLAIVAGGLLRRRRG